MSLLVMALPSMALDEAPYPQAEIVAEIRGGVLAEISEDNLRQLRSAIETHVMETIEATKSFPCMEWALGKRGSTTARARLLVELSERPYHNFSWIDLTLSGIVENAGPVHLRTVEGISSTLDDSWSTRNVGGLRQQVFRALDALFKTEEFRHTLESKFIAEVPIANSIDLNRNGHKVIVPVNAYRLKLVDGSPLNLRLIASMCNQAAGYCTIELASRGPDLGKFRDLLQCDVRLTECCRKQGWPPDFPGWMATRKADSVRVYLGPDHQHCLYNYRNCPDRFGTYRYPGSR
jgi:hypothetical protein